MVYKCLPDSKVNASYQIVEVKGGVHGGEIKSIYRSMVGVAWARELTKPPTDFSMVVNKPTSFNPRFDNVAMVLGDEFRLHMSQHGVDSEC